MSGVSAAGPRPQDQPVADQRSHEPSMEEILASIRRIISDDQMLPLSPRASLPPLPALGKHDRSTSFDRPSLRAPADLDAVSTELPGHESGSLPHDESPNASELPSDRVHHELGAPGSEAALDLSVPAGHGGEAPGSGQVGAMSAGGADHMTAHQQPDDEHQAPDGDDANPREDASIPVSAGPAHRSRESGAGSPIETHDTIISEHTQSSVASSFHQLAATMLMQNFPPVEDIARELLRPMLKTWLDDNLPVVVERLVRAEIERVSRGVK